MPCPGPFHFSRIADHFYDFCPFRDPARGLYTKQLRKKDVMALARVRISSQYIQFGIVHLTVTQEGCPGSR